MFARRQVIRTPDEGALAIIRAYGEVLEKANSSTSSSHPAAIFDTMYPDVSKLPYPKSVIDAAITYMMGRVSSEAEFEKLAGGRALLATYQDYSTLKKDGRDCDQASIDEMNVIVEDNKSRRSLVTFHNGNR
jgi:hypothetical protein